MQAVSYGINSGRSDKRIPLYINIGLCLLCILPQSLAIKMCPEEPADHDEVEREPAVEPMTI